MEKSLGFESFKMLALGIYPEDHHRFKQIKALLEYLEKTDFPNQPASIQYHLNIPGGLVAHSIGVYNSMEILSDVYGLKDEQELYRSALLISLFHDLCKFDMYRTGTRNRKDEKTGKWEAYQVYMMDEKRLPLGHGAKSVFLLQKYITDLTNDEALSIIWHMAGYTEGSKEFALSSDMALAHTQSRLIGFLQVADMTATFITEPMLKL